MHLDYRLTAIAPTRSEYASAVDQTAVDQTATVTTTAAIGPHH